MDVVVDASVLAEVIVETDGAAAEWLKALVGRDDMYWVPGLTPLEVISALRSLVNRDGEDFEPDAFEVDPRDVLPGDDGYDLIVLLDERECSPLEGRTRSGAGPRCGVGLDP